MIVKLETSEGTSFEIDRDKLAEVY